MFFSFFPLSKKYSHKHILTHTRTLTYAHIQLDNTSPQAYANWAQTLLNLRRPKEAVAVWERTLELAPHMESFIKGKIQKSQFGALSIDRDEAYAEGLCGSKWL